MIFFSTGFVMSQREDVHSSHATDGCHHHKHVVLQCHCTMDPILVETEKTGEGGRKANKCMHVVRREAKEVQLQSEMNPQIYNISNFRFDL